jgi:hypothetical protein
VRIKGLKTMAITAAAISAAFVASGGIAMASTSATAADSGAVTGLTESYIGNTQLTVSNDDQIDMPPMPTDGTYYVTGDVQVTIQPSDSVTCQVSNSVATYSATNPSSTASMWAVIPINLSVSTPAGHAIFISCHNYSSGIWTYLNSVTVNVTLVTNSTGTPTLTKL